MDLREHLNLVCICEVVEVTIRVINALDQMRSLEE